VSLTQGNPQVLPVEQSQVPLPEVTQVLPVEQSQEPVVEVAGGEEIK
jgi:hypothetical protein